MISLLRWSEEQTFWICLFVGIESVQPSEIKIEQAIISADCDIEQRNRDKKLIGD